MQSAEKVSNVLDMKSNKSKNKKRKVTRSKDMISAVALMHYKANTGKTWKEVSTDIGESFKSVSNWKARNRMPRHVLAKIDALEGRTVAQEPRKTKDWSKDKRTREGKAKEFPVRQHIRSRAPVPEDATTMYIIMVPGDQDKTLKSVLTALGCTYRKVDL